MVGYYPRENYTFRRICTWGLGVFGVIFLIGGLGVGEPGTILVGIIVGVGLIWLMIQTLRLTENWHLYESLSSGDKLRVYSAFVLGLLCVFLLVAIVWLGIAIGSSFKTKR